MNSISVGYLTGVAVNTIRIMRSRGALDELLGEENLRIAYTSPLFTLQRQGAVQRVLEFVQAKAQLAQIPQFQTFLDDIDKDRLSRWLGENSDVPDELFLTDEVLNQRRQAQAATEGDQQALQFAEGMQKAGVAPEQISDEQAEAEAREVAI